MHNNPLIYHAPRPKLTWPTFLLMITLRLIFPIILIWDLTKFIFNALFGRLIGRAILPAQDMYSHYQDQLDKEIEQHLPPEQFKIQRHKVITHDGAELDTLELGCGKLKAPKDQQYIIYLCGNALAYEDSIKDMADDAKALNCQVIGFNFRGVSQSTSYAGSKDQVITDALAQVQRLLDQGVDPEHITLKGFSFGGAVGTLATKHLHDHGLKVNIFNDRSFSSITNYLVGHIRRADWSKLNGHQESAFKILLGWIAKPLLLFTLALNNWELDAASAWAELPDTHKAHMVIRSPHEEREANPEGVVDDGRIPHYSSIHAAEKSERRALKQMIDKALNEIEQVSSTRLMNESLEEAAKHLRALRAAIKNCKMQSTHHRHENAHCDNAEELVSRDAKVNGKTFFRAFFERTQAHHQWEHNRSLGETQGYRNPGFHPGYD